MMSNETENVPALETKPINKNLAAIPLGGRLHALIPQSVDEAYRFAQAAIAAKAVPEGTTPESAFIAIVTGMEVGLPPMAALSGIAVINGRPTVWGDAALALVQGSGLMESIREWEENRPTDPRINNPNWREVLKQEDVDGWTAVCEVKRIGREPITRRFSIGEYRRANKLNGKGSEVIGVYPQRMIQMRARAWAIRDEFPDALKGLAIREEVQDIEARSNTAKVVNLQEKLRAGKQAQISHTERGGDLRRESDAPGGDDAGGAGSVPAGDRSPSRPWTAREEADLKDLIESLAQASTEREVQAVETLFGAGIKLAREVFQDEAYGLINARMAEFSPQKPKGGDSGSNGTQTPADDETPPAVK